MRIPYSSDSLRHSSNPFRRRLAPVLLALLLMVVAACSDSSTDPAEDLGFLAGADGDPRIGVVVNSTENALRLIQLGDPSEVRTIGLGASSSITATSLTSRGEDLVVPLGNAASVAHVNARTRAVERIFLFDGGNASGSLHVGGDRFLVLNLLDDQVGAFELGQDSDDITELQDVPPAPSSLVDTPAGVAVVSGNLDENFQPLGDGIVTFVDGQTLEVLGEVGTGGPNAGPAALGPDGLLYVVNTGNFVDPSSMAIIDPTGPTLVEVVDGLAPGSGSLHIDASGTAWISGFGFGTTAWDTGSRSFLRGPDNPVCVEVEGVCLGAASATTDDAGRLLQVHFGAPGDGVPGQIFVFGGSAFELEEEIEAGQGPTFVEVRTF
ncbi:MAG: hypothetical protein EA352_05290 [Gemmatimonadales bacterium]|nr:MAG: hypothetical protein EA352_05290 [Gemmatimonadales bacterium]